MLNDNFVTFEIGKAKHIALVAHDGKKKELIEWSAWRRSAGRSEDRRRTDRLYDLPVGSVRGTAARSGCKSIIPYCRTLRYSYS